MPNDNKKIIKDILSEYDNLRFLYEYGFGWDDNIAKKILGKSSQMPRKVDNQGIWDKIPNVNWEQNLKGRSSTRRLLNKNHYRMQKNQWIPYVYGMYGMRCDSVGYEYDNGTPDKYVKNYIKKGDGESNIWTQDKMIDNVFQDAKEYETFVQMLSFLVEVAPLSVLGYNFLRRLSIAQNIAIKKDRVEVGLTNPYIFVRRPFVHDALEQESIFRCLWAINNNCNIKIKGEIFIPEKIIYKDKGFETECENLYVRVKKDGKVESGLYDSKVIVDFYYQDGATDYLRDRRRNSPWTKYQIENTVDLDKETKLMKSPYYSDEKWFLERITYEVPMSEKENFYTFIRSFGDFAHIVEERENDIPLGNGEYVEAICNSELKGEYTLCNEWNSNGIFDEICDRIDEEGLNKCKFIIPTSNEVAWVKFVLENYPNFISLFFGVNSECIVDKLKEYINNNEPSLPNIFDEKIFDYNARVYDLKKDADKYMFLKCHKVLDKISNGTILEYKIDKSDKYTKILPYALEYNLIKHCTEKKKIEEAIKVMCYDLIDKRDVIVSLNDIKVNDKPNRAGKCEVKCTSKDDYQFSLLDKVYHILAYGVRSAKEGKTTIDSKYEQYIGYLFPEDTHKKKSKSEYVRNIKKHMDEFESVNTNKVIGNVDDISNELLKRLNEMSNEIFEYYSQSNPNITLKEKNYYFNMKYFLDKVVLEVLCGFGKNVSKARRDEVLEKLKNIESNDIWELIVGEDKDGIPNEIAYYDETLKCDTISFKLYDDIVEDSEKLCNATKRIYEMFSGYVCRGRDDSEKETLDLNFWDKRFAEVVNNHPEKCHSIAKNLCENFIGTISKADKSKIKNITSKFEMLKSYLVETLKDEEILQNVLENTQKFFMREVCKKDESVNLNFSLTYERFNYRDIHMRIMALSDIIDIESIEAFQEKQVLKQRYRNMKSEKVILSFELLEDIEKSDKRELEYQRIYEVFEGYVDRRVNGSRILIPYSGEEYKDIYQCIMAVSDIIDFETIEPFGDRIDLQKIKTYMNQKDETLTFELSKKNSDKVEKMLMDGNKYDISVDKLNDNSDVVFTVKYNSYHYRDLRMRMIALLDDIDLESIDIPEIKQDIQQRFDEKKDKKRNIDIKLSSDVEDPKLEIEKIRKQFQKYDVKSKKESKEIRIFYRSCDYMDVYMRLKGLKVKIIKGA